MSKPIFEIKAQGDVAEIRIVGNISYWKNDSQEFTRQLDELKVAGVTTLNAYINTGGGDVFQAFEIYNQLLAFEGKKVARLGALCASSGTYIALAFDEVEGAENLQYMIHNPSVYVEGDERVIESKLQLLKNIRATMLAAYVARTGLSEQEVSDMLNAETWMTSKRALELKFINRITGKDDAAPALDNSTDAIKAYGYKHVPQALFKATTSSINNSNQNSEVMKHLVIAALGLPGVTAESADADVVKGIQAVVNAKDAELATAQAKVKELEDKLQAEQDAKINALLDGAEKVQKITAEQKKQFEVIAKAGQYDTVKALIDGMAARTKIADVVNNLPKGGEKEEGQKDEAPKAESFSDMVYARVNQTNNK
jgi:ATP-dependent protease ClpP protease subunit/Skp family chaperone for outer membrane proteins